MMIKLLREVDLEGYTLIVPTVAVANAGQLSVDLLLHNNSVQKIGQVITPGLIPLAGANPYQNESSTICTTADVYIQQEKRLVIIQIRTPPVFFLTDFYRDLPEFVKNRKIAKVIILTSRWQYIRDDKQLRGPTLRYTVSQNIEDEFGKTFEKLKWCKMEESPVIEPNRELNQVQELALSLFEVLNLRQIPCAILFKYCSEGDNRSDAKELISYLDQWISVMPKDKDGKVVCKEPPSWMHMFGTQTPSEIY